MPEEITPTSQESVTSNTVITTPTSSTDITLPSSIEKNPNWNKLSIFSGTMLLMLFVLFIYFYLFESNLLLLNSLAKFDNGFLRIPLLFIFPILAFISGAVSYSQIQKTKEKGEEISIISSLISFAYIVIVGFVLLSFAEESNF